MLQSIQYGGLKVIQSNRVKGARIVEERRQDQSLLSANIVFTSPLRTGDSLTYSLPELVNQWNPDTNGTYTFGWSVERPTRSLVLRVRFSNNEVPRDPQHDVQRAGKMIELFESQHLEAIRVGPPNLKDTQDGAVLTLEVNYPVHGLVYILKWK